MSMKGRLAENIYILVGGRTNSPFPVGALKVAVSSRSEGSGWGGGGGMRLWYSKAPTSTSQTARVHSTLGKSSDFVAPVPLWQPWNVGGVGGGLGFGTTWALLAFRLNLLHSNLSCGHRTEPSDSDRPYQTITLGWHCCKNCRTFFFFLNRG